MAPLPKRKHSTRRKGKRLAHGTATPLPVLVACSNCGKTKMPHRICKYCNK
ncbi:50S ribosomal protein L32 [Candidatus Roizmanbacteria bacterium]|nr:50S ribosomal protein L32 [Candidatus Roizmanbacteria bacterium]